jgi:3-methylfumaryl-CoA hydratase
MDEFSAWVGRSEERTELLDPGRVNALRAALGQTGTLAEGDSLPPLHHWLHFWDVRTPAETGPDGHVRRGGFLPPVPLPRRMWAGGRLIFRAPLKLGERVSRISVIRAITPKSGRSGDLVFVSLSHALHSESGIAIEEEQDLVYRAESGGGAPERDAAMPAPDEAVMPDPVLLFRYSALTMNSHRIHYDHPYATGVEGYAGLVVQGPLQATLLAGLAERRLGSPLRTFRFRGVAPALAGIELGLHAIEAGSGLELWTSQQGICAMQAQAEPA